MLKRRRWDALIYHCYRQLPLSSSTPTITISMLHLDFLLILQIEFHPVDPKLGLIKVCFHTLQQLHS